VSKRSWIWRAEKCREVHAIGLTNSGSRVVTLRVSRNVADVNAYWGEELSHFGAADVDIDKRMRTAG
jgi:hypothetical protein